MPLIDFGALKTIPILQVLDVYASWEPVSWNGNQLRGPCPLHGSSPRSRSFAVRGGAWYCHKCKIGGDAVDLLIALTPGTKPYEAALELCDVFDLPVPYLPNASRNRKRNG